MKILFISENYPPHIEGGAEISTSLLAAELAKTNDVSVVCSQLADAPWNENGVMAYPIIRKASLGARDVRAAVKYAIDIVIAPIASSIRVLRFIKKTDPDVVNVVMTLYYFVPIILAIRLFARRPIFIDCRDYSLICPLAFRKNEIEDPKKSHHGYRCLMNGYQVGNKFLGFFILPFSLYESLVFNFYKSSLRYVINNFQGITLVPLSHYVQQQLVHNGFHENKTIVIPNISRHIDHSEGLKKALIPTFTYGGRIEKEKGVWDIVSAVEILQSEIKKPFCVKIAGRGSESYNLRKYLEKNSLPITLMGKLEPDQVLALYRESLAILAPSRWPEPFGRFIQESISVGTPVIATKAGGIPEGVQDGITGILVGVGKPEELAAAMRSFIQNSDQGKKMGARMMQEHWRYEADTIGKKRLELYSTPKQ